jgi:hypothetical protein
VVIVMTDLLYGMVIQGPWTDGWKWFALCAFLHRERDKAIPERTPNRRPTTAGIGQISERPGVDGSHPLFESCLPEELCRLGL